MRIAYFDCFSGASGDMILGACLDAGADLAAIQAKLADLPITGYRLEAAKIRKQGFCATQFTVHLDESTAQPHRHLKHVLAILDGGRLPPTVRQRAGDIFTRLAEAEAEVHGTTVEKVHFHEVGAVDAIVDIVGACLALEQLGIEQVQASAMVTGHGTVQCAHGLMPVPAPATARLLRGVPLAACDEPGELTTPTGAAILTTLATGFGPMPAMTVEAIGIGAGRHDGKTRPNVLRLLLGATGDAADAEADQILVLEANLDDATGQAVGYLVDRLLKAGVLDVFTTPIYMKKNRPGVQVTVLCEPARRAEFEALLFAESPTFGIRGHLADRHKLSRSFETVQTPLGPVRIKMGRRAGRIVQVSPEYEDCRALAEQTGRPLSEVIEQAKQAWNAGQPPRP